MTRGRWNAPVLLAALSLLPTGSFVLDPAASHVEFFVQDNRGGFTGVVPTVQATAVVREQDGTFAADVEAHLDARSITTGSGLRDRQMQHDFLLTDRYPEIIFRGTIAPVESVTQLSFHAAVHGQLTIKDITRDVAFPVRVIALSDSYLVDGTVTIRLTDFQIPIPRFFIFVAEDPVRVNLRLRFVAPPL